MDRLTGCSASCRRKGRKSMPQCRREVGKKPCGAPASPTHPQATLYSSLLSLVHISPPGASPSALAAWRSQWGLPWRRRRRPPPPLPPTCAAASPGPVAASTVDGAACDSLQARGAAKQRCAEGRVWRAGAFGAVIATLSCVIRGFGVREECNGALWHAGPLGLDWCLDLPRSAYSAAIHRSTNRPCTMVDTGGDAEHPALNMGRAASLAASLESLEAGLEAGAEVRGRWEGGVCGAACSGTPAVSGSLGRRWCRRRAPPSAIPLLLTL